MSDLIFRSFFEIVKYYYYNPLAISYGSFCADYLLYRGFLEQILHKSVQNTIVDEVLHEYVERSSYLRDNCINSLNDVFKSTCTCGELDSHLNLISFKRIFHVGFAINKPCSYDSILLNLCDRYIQRTQLQNSFAKEIKTAMLAKGISKIASPYKSDDPCYLLNSSLLTDHFSVNDMYRYNGSLNDVSNDSSCIFSPDCNMCNDYYGNQHITNFIDVFPYPCVFFICFKDETSRWRTPFFPEGLACTYIEEVFENDLGILMILSSSFKRNTSAPTPSIKLSSRSRTLSLPIKMCIDLVPSVYDEFLELENPNIKSLKSEKKGDLAALAVLYDKTTSKFSFKYYQNFTKLDKYISNNPDSLIVDIIKIDGYSKKQYLEFGQCCGKTVRMTDVSSAYFRYWVHRCKTQKYSCKQKITPEEANRLFLNYLQCAYDANGYKKKVLEFENLKTISPTKDKRYSRKVAEFIKLLEKDIKDECENDSKIHVKKKACESMIGALTTFDASNTQILSPVHSLVLTAIGCEDKVLRHKISDLKPRIKCKPPVTHVLEAIV